MTEIQTLHVARPKSRDGLNSYLFWALVAVIAVGPLPLGSNGPIQIGALCVVMAVLLLIWCLRTVLGKGTAVEISKLVKISLAVLGVCFVWIIIQQSSLVPSSWRDPLWAITGQALNEEIAGSISVAPRQGINDLSALFMYLSVFWIAFQTIKSPALADRSLFAVSIIGLIYSIYGLVVYAAGNTDILIYSKWAYKDSLTSTFVNRNSYATFIGLCLLSSFALLFHRVLPVLQLRWPTRQKIAFFIEKGLLSNLILLTGIIFQLASLILSASRAGNLVFGLGFLVLLISLMFAQPVLRRPLYASMCFGLVLIAAISLLAGSNVDRRLAQSDASLEENARAAIFESMMSAIPQSPWMGTGFGSFPDVFPAIQTAAVPAAFFWDKGHNDYLENILELGIPMAGLFFLGIGLLIAQCVVGIINRRRNKIFPIVATSASVLVCTHSFFDFSLQIPAVSVLYAFILGMGVRQSYRQR